MDTFSYIKAIAAALGWGFGFLVGGLDGILLTLIVFVCIDYLTGVMSAATAQSLSSAVGLKGICKKVLIFLLVGVANFLDNYIFQGATPMRDAVIFFYIANEGISILENTAKMGVPVPAPLEKLLLRLKEVKKDED